jgi:DNA-binding transcriptional LysR family regulator
MTVARGSYDNANPLSGSELAAFVAAVECASVHGAAEALRLSASAVTKRIQALERRLDTQLFERGRFGLRQTEAARLLYPEARQALAALQLAEQSVIESGPNRASILTLAASHTVGGFLLPGWLAAFRALGAPVRAKVEIVNSTGVIATVRDRQTEIGFVEGLDSLEGLAALDLYRDHIVVVVARGHRWAGRRTLAGTDLVGEPYLTREAGSGTRAVAAAGLARIGVELTPSLEAASTQSIKRALNAGGFALLSELAVETERHAGALDTLTVRGLELARDLRAIRDPRRRLPAASQRFWDWLQQRGQRQEDVTANDNPKHGTKG